MSRQSDCECIPCERHRIINRNAYWKRKRKHHLIAELPVLPPGYSCNCRQCALIRYRGTQRGSKRQEAKSVLDFVPGQFYEWDRTELRDYGPNAQRRMINVSRLQNETPTQSEEPKEIPPT